MLLLPALTIDQAVAEKVLDIGFVIAVGTYVKPLLKKAKAVAKTIGTVSADMGDTACKVPLASAYIEKVETAGRIGKKRKTIKC